MANNLKRFNTESEYNQASLNYPAVSWVTATDNVHFDKSGSTPTVNDKVMIASYGGEGNGRFIFYNCEASSSSDIKAITLDDVAVEPITCRTEYESVDASQLHIAKYDLNTTTVGDWCSAEGLGCMYSSNYAHIDILYPSQITKVGGWPNNTKNMVVEAETPPYAEGLESAFRGDGIYVPDSAVDAYKEANGWSEKTEIIHPISEYQGNLPV